MRHNSFPPILLLLAILAPVGGAQELTVVSPRNDRQQSPNLALNPNSVHERIWFRGRLVSYVEVNGLAMVEGDIVLGPAASLKAKAESSGAVDASIVTDEAYRWLEGVIPYKIEGLDPNLAIKVKAAIQHWEQNTSYRFIEQFHQANYVLFSAQDVGCYSYVGMIGGEQVVNLEAGCNTANAIHEIGHTVGLWHEQSRNDRDDYVQILYENIDPSMAYNFDTTGAEGTDIGYYDYGSIMHYPDWGFSINGQPTMITIPPGIPIGEATALSLGDIYAVEKMNGAPARPFVVNTLPAGFDVIVDGAPCTAPCTFTGWAAGSQHTVAVDAFQTANRVPLMHGAFARWNDNGDLMHTITVDPQKPVVTAFFIANENGDLPDLTITSMTAPLTVNAGQGKVSVAATVRNSGQIDARPFNVGFYLSGDSNITRSDRFLGWYCRFELGLAVGASAACRGEVEIPADAPTGLYYIGALADDNGEVSESNELNNGLANQNGATQVNSSVAALPDLTVSSFTVPASGAPNGRLVGAKLTVTNRGQGAAGRFRVGVYLSKSPMMTTRDVYTRWSCLTQTGLAPGDMLTCSGDIGVPSSVKPGYYYLAAIADDLSEVTESDEGNNARTADPGRVLLSPDPNPKPDLVPVSLTTPATVTLGQRISGIQVEVANLGGAKAGPFRVGFYLSRGLTTSALTLLDRTCTFPGLEAGGSVRCTVDATLPTGMGAGSYLINALVDDLGQVAESDETNNMRWSDSGAVVVKAGSQPDLAITDVNAPVTGKAGERIPGLRVTVKNQGNGAAGPFRIGLAFVNAAGAKFPSASSCAVADGLAAGASYICSGEVEIPETLAPGMYTLVAEADDQHVVAESNEDNNTRANSNGAGFIEGAAPRPDLIVTAFAAPATGGIGKTLPGVTVTVKNQGGARAGRFRAGFYISTSATISLASLFTGWYCMVDNGLAAGESFTCTRDISLPDALTPGVYYFGAIADDLGAVSESNERNNTRANDNGATTISR